MRFGKALLILFLFSTFVSKGNTSDVMPPNPFIDKGACPFECCTYRDWTVEKDTELYESITSKKVIGHAKKGDTVKGLTGEVHTIPGIVQVTANHSPYAINETVYVLTYEGEGIYKTWYKGKFGDDNGIYTLFNKPGTAGYCGDDKAAGCWGKVQRQPDSIWWAQIQLPDGKIGWTHETNNFGNQDSCG